MAGQPPPLNLVRTSAVRDVDYIDMRSGTGHGSPAPRSSRAILASVGAA
jgi:hypothetical protein